MLLVQLCACSVKCGTPTQSSPPGLEANPLELWPQAAPQLHQSLLHPLGLPAPALQHTLAHVLRRRGRWWTVRWLRGTHTAA